MAWERGVVSLESLGGAGVVLGGLLGGRGEEDEGPGAAASGCVWGGGVGARVARRARAARDGDGGQSGSEEQGEVWVH